MLESTMMRSEVIFVEETVLKKMKSRINRFPGYRFSMDTLGWWDKRGPSEIIQAQQGWSYVYLKFVHI